jgi:hypothetical protein
MTRRGPDSTGFAAVLPLIDGAEASVRDALAALPNGPASPFAALPATHFVRLVLLPRFRDRNGHDLAGVPPCLFFAAESDMFAEGFLEALCTQLPGTADAIFGRCAGYPGAHGPPAFKRWMLDHRVRPGFSVLGNPGADAARVQRSLALREEIAAFALDAQRFDAAELHKRFRQRWKAAP